MNSIIKEDILHIIDRFDNWERFKNKTILITGANGFLSAYLVQTFLTLDTSFNTKVIALVRNKQKALNRFDEFLNNSNLEIIEHDVCNEFSYEHSIDYIIHAASQASPKYYKIDPVGTLNANVLGTINFIKLAQKKQVESFLYFSSGEVYGELKEEEVPIKEDTFGYLNPTLVRSCYGESKRMGENICVSYHTQFGIKAKIVRPFHTYGPGMSLDDGRVFADFVANIVNKQNIVLNSDGSAKRAFCYLTDATIGFLTILLNGKNGEAYNLGNPQEEYSILDLAKKLINMYPELKLEVILNASTNTNYLKSTITRNSPNIDKLRKLNWNPTVTVKEGFKRTISSFL